MLVLNTNQGGGGAFIYSNENIMQAYPDFKESILLLPNGFTTKDTDEIYSVVGTVVNGSCGKLLFGSNISTGAQYNNSCGVAFSAVATEKIVRFGFTEPIESGLKIGKKVIFPKLGITYNTNTTCEVNSVYLKVGLLHSDGTITYIATGPTQTNVRVNSKGYYSSSNYYIYKDNLVLSQVENQNSFITQEGDILIFEVVANVSRTDCIVCFGLYNTYYQSFEITPIQVSIDN